MDQLKPLFDILDGKDFNHLTAENYWQTAFKIWPNALLKFGEWIGLYQKSPVFDFDGPGAYWGSGFNNSYDFNKLPFEMQFGIILKFFRDLELPVHLSPENDEFTVEAFLSKNSNVWIITELFQALEEYLTYDAGN